MSPLAQYLVPVVVLGLAWLLAGAGALMWARRRGKIIGRDPARNCDAWLASLTIADTRKPED